MTFKLISSSAEQKNGRIGERGRGRDVHTQEEEKEKKTQITKITSEKAISKNSANFKIIFLTCCIRHSVYPSTA